MPYYFLPFFPIVFAPIFISLSDLKPKQKLFYSLYPLVLFVFVIIIHKRSRQPRNITFESKGWFTIIYNIQNETKLNNRGGYKEINFQTEPILLTSTKQMDIIPVSKSRYFYIDNKEKVIKKIFYNSDIQYKRNNQDTSLYIYYERIQFDSLYCFREQNELISRESFFIGTIEEYFQRDSIYPISKRNIRSNNFFKNYCNYEDEF